jgi:3-methyladenine DNA glycosylase/8-oxoguanine DNA glycosylase
MPLRHTPIESGVARPDLVARLPRPPFYALRQTVRFNRLGRPDPTRELGDDTAILTTRTEDGEATLRVTDTGSELDVEVYGRGAATALDRAPGWLGLLDDPAALRTDHPIVSALAAAHPGLRLARAPMVVETLVPIVLQQKVTFVEAARAWRILCLRFGDDAPGPFGLKLAPTWRTLATLSPWAYRNAGVHRAQAATVRRIAERAPRLEEIRTMDPADAVARLRGFPGVGWWTAQTFLGFGLGHPDAVPVGDIHMPHTVAWALAGEPRGTDERMLELLEPWRGQRWRVLRLIFASGMAAPARGPRVAPRPLPPGARAWLAGGSR